MSKFTRPLCVSPLPDGKRWVLREEFSYDIGHKGSGHTVIIPSGFVTDFASVPRVFWTFYPKWEKYGNAAVIHDFLYWEQFYSRTKTDKIFLEGMKVLKVEKVTRSILYNAVRLFGGFAWKSNAEDRMKGKKKIIDLSDW